MLDMFEPSDTKVLMSQIALGSHARSYLFYGADYFAQREAVVAYAEAALNQGLPKPSLAERLEKAAVPDFAEFGEAGEIAKIADARSLSSFIKTTALEFDMKIGVVYEANRLDIRTQNVLLKTLEEPTSDSIVILACHSTAGLLATVRSRLHEAKLRNKVYEIGNEQGEFLLSRLEAILDGKNLLLIFSTASALAKMPGLAGAIEYLYMRIAKLMAMKATGEASSTAGLGSAGMACLNKMCAHASCAIGQIAGNSPAQLALEVMLIKMLEDFDAEDSGC